MRSTKVLSITLPAPMLKEAKRLAREENVAVVKFIHGYGSTGAGGEIRIAVQAELAKRREQGELKAVIFGEDWRISNEAAWEVLKKIPELKRDIDLGRQNEGISLVFI